MQRSRVMRCSLRLVRIIREPFVEVTISGRSPRLPGGWALLGVVSLRDQLPIIREVPGQVVPADQRDRGSICDHCQKARRRAETFILQAEDGRVVQVGRQCLADFLGSTKLSPGGLIAYVWGLDAFREEETGYEPTFGGVGGRAVLDVRYVVLLSGAVIDEEGWVSKKVSQECLKPSTANGVDRLLHPPLQKSASAEYLAWAERVQGRLTEKLETEVDAALAWARNLGTDNPTTYLANLAAIACQDTVGAENLGLTVSLLASYRREQETLQRKEFARKMANPEWVGAPGQRLSLRLRLVNKRAFEGSYGPSYRCAFEDEVHHSFVWWASNDPAYDEKSPFWSDSDFVAVKATVKKHDSWEGIRQTVLTRVKVV